MADPRRPRGGVPKVISHYRIGKLLGGGGMGEVYLATDRRDGSTVALKLLHPHLAHDEAFRERFEREAHVGAILRSPYTVHLLDHGLAQGHYFIVMEYVEGVSLKEALRSGPLEPRRALRIAAQVARALEEAEARGVIHRDIKPDNIFAGAGDSVKVGDFGIARQVGGGTLTTPGAFVGTLAYAAPELALGRADHRSDIYSLGATLYHVLTGRPPFQGDALEVLRHHQDTPLPLEPLAGLPPAAIEIITRCLEKDPERRYQTASALAGALEHAAVLAPAPEAVTPAETVVSAPDTIVAPAGDGAATQVAPPPAPETRGGDAPTEVRPPEKAAVAGPAPLTLELVSAKAGGRLSSARYALTVRNGGGSAVDAALSASDTGGRCAFTLPKSVSVPAGGAATVNVAVRPRSRRWRGAEETLEFTVSASGSGGGPPVTASGRFDDVPFGWLPAGALLAAGAVPAAIAAVLLLGGGGGGGEDGGATTVSAEDISQMVLPLAELGPDYAAFEPVSKDFGAIPNDIRIADSCDPLQEEADVEAAGRVAGHAAPYSSEDVRASGQGAFLVSTAVEQYGSAAGAQDDLQAFADDPAGGLTEPECRHVEGGITEEFDPGVIGDGARGTDITLSQAGGAYSITVVAFTDGSLGGRVTIMHWGGPIYREYAAALARKLDERIQRVVDVEQVAARTQKPVRTRAPSPGVSGSPGPSESAAATAAPATGATQPPGATAPPGATTGPKPTNPPAVTATPRPTNPPGPTNPPATNPPQAPSISSVGCPGSATTADFIYCAPSVSGTVTSWSWWAPGGSPETGSGGTFSTLFSSAGTMTVQLTACNGGSCGSLSQYVSVSSSEVTFAIYVDSVAVETGGSTTVDIWADAPPPGLGYYDIDIDYDSSLLTAIFCVADFDGDCDNTYDGTVAFSGYSGLSDFVYLGSITFEAGYVTGISNLTIYTYAFEDTNGVDMTYDTIRLHGEIEVY